MRETTDDAQPIGADEARAEVHAAWRNLSSVIRSDSLAAWHEVLRGLPTLAPMLGVPNRLRLVVDANVALADLRWMVKKRTNPAARSNLEEVIASGTVVAFAPPVMREQVEKGLRDLADEEGIPHDRLVAAWASYQGLFSYYEPPPALSAAQRAAVRDPSDQPYVDLQIGIEAAAIYTEDPDLRGMRAPVVGQRVLGAARAYARSASISFTLRIGGVAVLATGIAVLAAVARLVVGGVRAARRLPDSVQLVLMAGLAVALLHPQSRRWLLTRLASMGAEARDALFELAPLVAQAAEQETAAAGQADAAWKRVRDAVPAPRSLSTQPLRVHVLAACVRAGAPLTVDEIASGVAAQGYRGGTVPARSYLMRVLGSHPSLVRTSEKRWQLRPA